MGIFIFVLSSLVPIRVRVPYAPVPPHLLFCHHCGIRRCWEREGEGAGAADALGTLGLLLGRLGELGGWGNGLTAVAERRGLSQPLGVGGEKGEMCLFLVMSD